MCWVTANFWESVRIAEKKLKKMYRNFLKIWRFVFTELRKEFKVVIIYVYL